MQCTINLRPKANSGMYRGSAQLAFLTPGVSFLHPTMHLLAKTVTLNFAHAKPYVFPLCTAVPVTQVFSNAFAEG